MPDAAVRPSRLRLLLYVSLILTIAMAVLVGWMLHWDDQLKLYWHEQYVDSQERAASIWLPDYELALETTLFGLEDDETSGLTWNAATGTLFTVTGQNPQLVEFSPGGVVLRRITLTGFSDPEAVEALDDGRLGIVDERRRLVAVFRLAPGVESLDLDDLATYDLGFDGAGNKGFEGLAWNPRTKRMLLAKERDPQGLFELPFPGEDGAAGILEAWPEQPLLVRDISSVTIDPRTGHTLMLSDESRLLVELDQRGRPLSFIRLLGGLNGLVEGIDQAEGVAMDEHGDIYVVAEPNLLYVFRRKR
ncbi:SdiA-regulated domain-containing protein [Stutzerimonas zhaodongensis]|uniref:DNA-binding protein n=1 Tax=Stutzerimonas zhaodongensis TaxID=1176257 RepID=A0A365PUQ6_9GAMM|nr:SdiA-regulated domain-containing protein [Stutzerimonas zhaodongensis]QWV17538.1 SdiA-regulated domain-containing protein [Stutzerimonas zhaodongensis]RBA58754.1 DNA-binding protein [Stutzerimonas zhaodongensis]